MNTIEIQVYLSDFGLLEPRNGSTKVVVCSDDHLLKLGITRADHIIHYDLPDSFETFSLRYSVFTNSHCRLQVNFELISFNEIYDIYLIFFRFKPFDSKPGGSMKDSPTCMSTSTLFYMPQTNYGQQTICILSLLGREYVLHYESPKLKKQLYVSG